VPIEADAVSSFTPIAHWGKRPYTEEQLGVMRGGLTVEKYWRRQFGKWKR